jgi:hypothetical protein
MNAKDRIDGATKALAIIEVCDEYHLVEYNSTLKFYYESSGFVQNCRPR